MATVEPELRPKGMGLGADKIIHRQKNLVKTNQQEEDGDLQLIRGGFCKIIAGSNQGKYCEVCLKEKIVVVREKGIEFYGCVCR